MGAYKVEAKQQRANGRHEEDVDEVRREILEPRLGLHGDLEFTRQIKGCCFEAREIWLQRLVASTKRVRSMEASDEKLQIATRCCCQSVRVTWSANIDFPRSQLELQARET